MPSTAIPRASLVLVTGVNGLIALHVVHALLSAGYRVRGTVRSRAHVKPWLYPHLQAVHGNAVVASRRFELVQVADFHAEGCWDAVFGDGQVAGVVSVAGGSGRSAVDEKGVDGAVADELRHYESLLVAARRSRTVRNFVMTGSAWAAYLPRSGVEGVVTHMSWNDEVEGMLEDPTTTTLGDERRRKRMYGVMAKWRRTEQGVWEWVRRERPGFAFNVVLLSTVLGPIPVPEAQEGSTAGMLRRLWDGGEFEALAVMPPQYFIDVRDAARLFLAVLTTTGVNGRRLFGLAERYNAAGILEVMKEAYPGRTEWPDLLDNGWCEVEVPNEEAEELLRSVGDGKGWTSLADSVRDCVESFLVRDDKGLRTLRSIKVGETKG